MTTNRLLLKLVRRAMCPNLTPNAAKRFTRAFARLTESQRLDLERQLRHLAKVNR